MKLPFVFLNRQLTFFGAGFLDQIKTRISGEETSFFKTFAQKLHKCEPWTDHYYPSALKDIFKALALKDFSTARIFAVLGQKEDADIYCVKLMQLFIEMIACGDEVTIELFLNKGL